MKGKNVTVRLSEDKVEALDDEAEREGESRAEYIRNLIDSRHESDERIADLEKTLDECQTTVDRLKNEKRLILEEREEKQELVRYVESERSLSEKKARAGVITRAKWFLSGVPEE